MALVPFGGEDVAVGELDPGDDADEAQHAQISDPTPFQRQAFDLIGAPIPRSLTRK